jgi:hypothetical protein
MNEAPPTPERLRAMEDLLASREELGNLVQCILDWRFKKGPFLGAHLAFEYSHWEDSPETFNLSLARPVVQQGEAWKNVCVIRRFFWQYLQGGAQIFHATTIFRRGTVDLAGRISPHKKDQCIAYASFADVFDALSSVRASIPESAFTKIPR